MMYAILICSAWSRPMSKKRKRYKEKAGEEGERGIKRIPAEKEKE